MFNKIYINIPSKINILIFIKNYKKKKFINIILQDNKKKFSFYVNNEKSLLKYDKNTNSIMIEKNWLYNNNNKFSNFILKFLKSWNYFFFSKIKFKGKGFRIRFLKKNKLVKFFFGRSHKTFINFRKILLKKINKYKFILKGIDYNKIIYNTNLVTKIKPLNVYTLRGLRCSKQIMYKRKGKKGTYI